MKKKTLKTLGIMVLGAALLAGAVTGCGSKETADMAGTETVAEAVTETEEPTEMVEVTEETETELQEETEVTGETEEAPAFTVTELSAVKYATQTVNVRKEPSADHEKLGSLTAGQKVTVTGQADTGWYRINYNGVEGYVSDKYLSDQKVSTPAKGTAGSGNTAGTNSGNAGGADQGGNAVTPDNSGSTDAGSSGGTDAGNTGDTSGNSGAPSDNWWESPEFDDVEDFVPQPGTGADDGSGLSGGTSTWH